jgi:hypothetical protein
MALLRTNADRDGHEWHRRAGGWEGDERRATMWPKRQGSIRINGRRNRLRTMVNVSGDGGGGRRRGRWRSRVCWNGENHVHFGWVRVMVPLGSGYAVEMLQLPESGIDGTLPLVQISGNLPIWMQNLGTFQTGNSTSLFDLMGSSWPTYTLATPPRDRDIKSEWFVQFPRHGQTHG